jgi:transcriptional regulator with XRE-family HTH domain
MDLALDVGVSTRHLSCIETGRARPSPAMLLGAGRTLQVPLRERNRCCWQPAMPRAMPSARWTRRHGARCAAALQRLLDAHEPYPGLVLDRQWNVVLANRPRMALVACCRRRCRARR